MTLGVRRTMKTATIFQDHFGEYLCVWLFVVLECSGYVYEVDDY